MSTQDILLSQKFNNYNYAPGIATYGIDGKTGQAGTDGNNIYFTDCNLLTDTDKDLKILAELIANNYLPVKGSTTQINRSYKNNDLFFDYNGIIYQLTNIDDLIGNKNVGGIYSDYFNIAGKINIADISNVFTWVGDRMILNSSTYGGYDVVTINNPSNAENYINKDAVVNIISDNVNENSNIEMIKLQSIDDVDIEDGKLSVYYKTTENAFYLDSNKPIVINGDVKLNNDNNTNNEYDNFSIILTSNDTVTYFKHICDKLRYNVLYDSEVNRYKLIIYQEDGGSDNLEYLVNRNETVYGKVYDGENNQQLLKLSDIIYGPINYDSYINHMPVLNVSGQGDTSKTDFVLNSSIIYKNMYELKVENDNRMVNISFSAKDSSILAEGKAASSTTFYSSQIGKFNVSNGKNVSMNDPYGIAFNTSSGYVLVKPKSDIPEHSILTLKVFKNAQTSDSVDDSTNIEVTKNEQTTTPALYPLMGNNITAWQDDRANNKTIGTFQHQFEDENNLPNASDGFSIKFKNTAYRLQSCKISFGDNTLKTWIKNKWFAVCVSQIGVFKLDVDTNITTNIASFVCKNENNIYQFEFDANNFPDSNDVKQLCISFYPLNGTYNIENAPIKVFLDLNKLTENNISGKYIMQFGIEYLMDSINIKNIMFFDKDQFINETKDGDIYHIENYLPNSVETVQKFSLLHNTEVFINYQE